MKKRSGKFWLSLFIFALTLVLPAVSALPATLDNAYRGLVSIGNLSFIGVSDGAMVVGLTRLLIWILVFTIIYALIAPTNKKSPLSFLAKNQAMVVALVMATVAAIFLPASVLMATGAGWATAVALILIGLPVVGVGYLLIKMVLDDNTWLAVRTTPGITSFVGTSNKPTPLPPQEVLTIQRFMKMEAPKFKTTFSVGEAVKIVDGPFAEFLGSISEIDEAKGKVKVLVSIFGRETPVELDFLQVAKL